MSTLQSCGIQHTRLPCPSPSPGVRSNSCPLSQWCHQTISSSVTLFSSCPQCFPASESSNESLFASGGQSIGASASASVLPMYIQGWFPLGLTGLISLQSKGLSGVFSSTTIRKHQFFSAQPSLWFNFHIHTWLWHKLPPPKKWPQRKWTSRLELKINCYLKQSRWHWSDHCMTDFKMTVRAGCAVSVCSPLPWSIKALVHWLSVVGAGKSSFRQKSTAPCLLASKIKQTFFSTSLASLLAFE